MDFAGSNLVNVQGLPGFKRYLHLPYNLIKCRYDKKQPFT